MSDSAGTAGTDKDADLTMSGIAAMSVSGGAGMGDAAGDGVGQPASADAESAGAGSAAEGSVRKRDPRYPLTVQYCAVCTLPPEVHEYLSRAQLDRCADWLRTNAPLTFPDRFPEEAAAARAAAEAAAAAAEGGVAPGPDAATAPDAAPPQPGSGDGTVKVALPVPQKGTVGKKKKIPAEIIVQLAKRKQKTVTVVYGLDLFGIKLPEAAKAAKKKFASGASVARSADNRDVVEIQGTRMEDFARLAHNAFGVPKESIFLVDTKKKTKICPFNSELG